MWPTAIPLDITETTFEPALREWLGLEGADEMGGMTLIGAFKKTPASIQHRFLFTGLDLTWDASEDAFVSGENGRGIVSMDKQRSSGGFPAELNGPSGGRRHPSHPPLGRRELVLANTGMGS